MVLPFALEQKFPNAATDWRWQFVFPAAPFVAIRDLGRRRQWIHPFQPLNIRMTASVRQTPLPTAAASDPPYLYSSDTTDFGVTFPAPPGEQIRLRIHAEISSALPDGELVVQPQWPGPQKDRIVAAMLEESTRPYLSGAGVVGLLLLVVGLGLHRSSPG